MRTTYPQLSLPIVIRYLEKHRDDILGVSTLTRDEALELLGFTVKSGAGQTTLGSMRQYGLLNRIEGKYIFTELAKRILDKNSSNYKDYISEAASNPELFVKLNEYYTSENFYNIAFNILNERGVSIDKIDKVIQTYINTKRFTGDKTQSSLSMNQINNKKDGVSMTYIKVDFGNGMTINIPKKIVLKAYVEELKKIEATL